MGGLSCNAYPNGLSYGVRAAGFSLGVRPNGVHFGLLLDDLSFSVRPKGLSLSVRGVGFESRWAYSRDPRLLATLGSTFVCNIAANPNIVSDKTHVIEFVSRRHICARNINGVMNNATAF